MATTPSAPEQELPTIILYHYPFSPYARRIVWYLRLRGIPYLECIQPPLLPRPDLSTHLGIAYRRIPVLAVARDVYLDTRLILRKLEALPAVTVTTDPSGPNQQEGRIAPPLGVTFTGGEGVENAEALALERLLGTLTTGTDLFFQAARLLPEGLALMRDERFRRDREDFFHGGKGGSEGGGGGGGGGKRRGGGHEEEREGEEEEGERDREREREVEAEATRAEALHAVKAAFTLLETTLLADGREWILGDKNNSDGPSLADIEAVWPFHWLTGLPGALFDQEQVSRKVFPRVYAWVERFQRVVGAAKETVPVRRVSGEEAARILLGEGEGEGGAVGFFEPEAQVDGAEPIAKVFGFEKGSRVEVWPTDSGVAHRDRGRLVGLGPNEVVWQTDAGVRVHAPRVGFRVRPAQEVAAGEETNEKRGPHL